MNWDHTIDFPDFERIGDGSRLEQELTLKPLTKLTRRSFSAEPEHFSDLGFIGFRGGFDSPGAKDSTSSSPHVVETRMLNAELSKVSRALFGFGDHSFQRLDPSFALRH